MHKLFQRECCTNNLRKYGIFKKTNFSPYFFVSFWDCYMPVFLFRFFATSGDTL